MIDKFIHISITFSVLIAVSLMAFLLSKDPSITTSLGQLDLSIQSIIGVVLLVLAIIFLVALISFSVALPVFIVNAAILLIYTLATKLFIRVTGELTDKREFTLRRFLRLFLTEEEEENIVGDLSEEFTEIAANKGEWYAKIWYYKQVKMSAWPLIIKAIKWGVWAWVGQALRRFI